MSHPTSPRAIERAIKSLAKTITDAVAQINSHAHPEHNGACQKEIMESLLQIVECRVQQRGMDPLYDFHMLTLGLQRVHIHPDFRFGDLRRVEKVVNLDSVLMPG